MKDPTRRAIACFTLLALSGVFAEINMSRAEPEPQRLEWGTDYRSYVGSNAVTVGAAVRRFQSGAVSNAHPDFRRLATGGPGRYANIMTDELGPDGKPVFRSTGNKVIADWRDAGGNAIAAPRGHVDRLSGDRAGQIDTAAGGAVTSAQSFAQWYRDVPGVNSTSRSTLTFARQGSNYVFDGSLDSLTGTNSLDYTAEASMHFVYEAGRDYYFTAATNAEIWVYIDGKLVIDGGGMGGAQFRIENGTVVPLEPVNASVTIVGAAIQSGSTTVPVTVGVKAGTQTFAPFGPTNNPATGNVNDNRNPRHAVIGNNLPAGTPISVSGISWLGSPLAQYISLNSTPANAGVKVLRNGDAVPDIRPFQNQASIASFLRSYIDPASNRVTLQSNQTIFLFELGTRSLTSEAADFQDLVALVTLSQAGGTSTTPGTTSGSTSEAPSLGQRIDLSRLSWLEDRGSYQMQIFYANRTGVPSRVRLETNIATLNLANRPVWPGKD